MKLHCEEMANRILPAIRAEAAVRLYREYGMKQIDISKILGITQGAVSHYLTSFRGKEREMLNSVPEVKKEMDRFVLFLSRGDFNEEIVCRICRILRKLTPSNP